VRRSGTAVRPRKSMSPVSGFMRLRKLIFRWPDRSASGYDAFISYSHLEDDALAATLQAGLETFACPWYRPRALRVFRDITDLTATPGLLTEIIGALSVSRWFVLVASERAAQSHWVNEEVSWWLANRDHKRILIVLSGGEIHWQGRDFDWGRTTALPFALAGAFSEEPGWIDLREVKNMLGRGEVGSGGRLRRLTSHRARRQVGDWAAALAAPIRGMAKDNLVGEHLRYRKRTRRVVQAVLAIMLTLTVAASAAAALAADQLAQARLQNRIATSRELAALSGSLLGKHLDLAELFAAEAYQLDPSPQALSALFQAVTASPYLRTYLSADGQVSAIAGSPDGRVIVAGQADGTVLRWSLPDIKPAVIARINGAVTSVSVDDSGNAVAALSQSAALRWDAGRGVRLLRVPRGQVPIGVSVSASGRFTALASAAKATVNDQFELTLYSRNANPVNVTRIKGQLIGPLYLSFAGDSRLVTLDSALGTWHRISVPDLTPLGVFSNLFPNEYVAAMSPGGEFLASSGGGPYFSLWDLKPGSTAEATPRQISSSGAAPTALAINTAGTLGAQADDGSIYVSNLTRGGSSLTLTGNNVINNGGLAFAGRSELLSASGDLLTVWNLRQYSRIATQTSVTAPFSCDACSGPLVAVQPDGRRVAVVSGNGGTVTAQALSSGGKPTVTRSDIMTYGMPVWSQDGGQLLVPTVDGGAEIWSADQGLALSGKWTPSASLQRALGDSSVTAQPEAVQFRPGNRQVVEVDSTGAIVVRNAVTGKVAEFIKGPPSLVDDGEAFQNFAAVDSAGQVAAVVTSRGIIVTSIGTRRSRTLPGNSADTVAFYGEQLLVQQSDGLLQIWNASATHLIRVIAGLAGVVAGPVVDQAGLAVETGSDGSAAVIDLNSGVTLGTIVPPAGPRIQSVGIAMPAESTSLVTITEGDITYPRGDLTDWQMSVSAWLKVACASAGHTLTTAEWQEYVGGSPPEHLACADAASR
jgi:WD40 repeat protein